MAGTVGYGLVIYNRGEIWWLESEVFRADPPVTNYTPLDENLEQEWHSGNGKASERTRALFQTYVFSQYTQCKD